MLRCFVTRRRPRQWVGLSFAALLFIVVFVLCPVQEQVPSDAELAAMRAGVVSLTASSEQSISWLTCIKTGPLSPSRLSQGILASKI